MHDSMVTVLEAARARIADPQCYVVGALARNSAGYNVEPTAPDAVQWCAIGAMRWALEQGGDGDEVTAARVKYALYTASMRLYRMATPQVNDNLGHAAPLEVYAYAIAKAKGRR